MTRDENVTTRQPLPNEADLGAGHHWAWAENGDGYWHDGNCRSWHRIDLTSGERHALRQREPLSIEGSLPCHECGAHGFVISGRWVDA